MECTNNLLPVGRRSWSSSFVSSVIRSARLFAPYPPSSLLLHACGVAAHRRTTTRRTNRQRGGCCVPRTCDTIVRNSATRSIVLRSGHSRNYRRRVRRIVSTRTRLVSTIPTFGATLDRTRWKYSRKSCGYYPYRCVKYNNATDAFGTNAFPRQCSFDRGIAEMVGAHTKKGCTQ